MSIFGTFWLILSIVLLPFGYRPIVFLLILSSIFQASTIITIGKSTIPLYLGIELIAIMRLILPYKDKGLLKFNDILSGLFFITISLIWLMTYLLTHMFEGIRVYSGKDSFEDSYIYGGSPLTWGDSNINQLIILSTHLFFTLVIFKRRYNISKEFCFNAILYTIVLFSIMSLIWKFLPNIYNYLAIIMYNNDVKDIPSGFLEHRLSGTFSEPSYAGIFIATFLIPLLTSKKIKFRLLGVVLVYLGYLNLSTTFVFGLLMSVVVIVIFSNINIRKKIIFISSIFLISIFIYGIVYDYIYNYIFNKSISTSGVVRSSGNTNAINNFISSYFLGIGVGSERASSLLINTLNNLGAVLSFLIVFLIKNVISFDKNNYCSHILKLFLFTTLFGCFSSIPEYTFSFLWVLVFSNVCISRNQKNIL